QEVPLAHHVNSLRASRFIHGDTLPTDRALEAFLGQAAAPAPLGADWTLLSLYSRPQFLPEPTLLGPFDYNNSQGEPLIHPEVKNQVLQRRGLLKHPPTDEPPPMMPRPPGPPP